MLRNMPRNIPFRIAAIVLAVLTLAAIILASINYSHENDFQAPTDGIWWAEGNGGLIAQKVLPASPGERAGIETGDLLTSVNDHPITRLAALQRQIFSTGIYSKATYTVIRSGIPLEIPVILMAVIDRGKNDGRKGQDREYDRGYAEWNIPWHVT